MKNSNLYQAGKECFSVGWILFENALLFLNWGLGFYLLLPFKAFGISILSWLYLCVIIVVQILLKKHYCSLCYYYGKRCHLGWGKLSCALFKRDSGNRKIGTKLTLSYILQLPVITVLALIAGFVYGFTGAYIFWLGVFIFVNVFQGVFLRKKTCALCKMRFCCPGSAAKKNE